MIVQTGERQVKRLSKKFMVGAFFAYMLLIFSLVFAVLTGGNIFVYATLLTFIFFCGFMKFLRGHPLIEPGYSIVPVDKGQSK